MIQHQQEMLPFSTLQISTTTKAKNHNSSASESESKLIPVAGGHGVGMKQIMALFASKSQEKWSYELSGTIPGTEGNFVSCWKSLKQSNITGVQSRIFTRSQFMTTCSSAVQSLLRSKPGCSADPRTPFLVTRLVFPKTQYSMNEVWLALNHSHVVLQTSFLNPFRDSKNTKSNEKKQDLYISTPDLIAFESTHREICSYSVNGTPFVFFGPYFQEDSNLEDSNLWGGPKRRMKYDLYSHMMRWNCCVFTSNIRSYSAEERGVTMQESSTFQVHEKLCALFNELVTHSSTPAEEKKRIQSDPQHWVSRLVQSCDPSIVSQKLQQKSLCFHSDYGMLLCLGNAHYVQRMVARYWNWVDASDHPVLIEKRVSDPQDSDEWKFAQQLLQPEEWKSFLSQSFMYHSEDPRVKVKFPKLVYPTRFIQWLEQDEYESHPSYERFSYREDDFNDLHKKPYQFQFLTVSSYLEKKMVQGIEFKEYDLKTFQGNPFLNCVVQVVDFMESLFHSKPSNRVASLPKETKSRLNSIFGNEKELNRDTFEKQPEPPIQKNNKLTRKKIVVAQLSTRFRKLGVPYSSMIRNHFELADERKKMFLNESVVHFYHDTHKDKEVSEVLILNESWFDLTYQEILDSKKLGIQSMRVWETMIDLILHDHSWSSHLWTPLWPLLLKQFLMQRHKMGFNGSGGSFGSGSGGAAANLYYDLPPLMTRVSEANPHGVTTGHQSTMQEIWPSSGSNPYMMLRPTIPMFPYAPQSLLPSTPLTLSDKPKTVPSGVKVDLFALIQHLHEPVSPLLDSFFSF